MKKLISWVEIPCNNFERAVDFYESILNLKFKVIDCDDEKMACFPNGEGAISFAPDFKPSKNGALVSFNSEKGIDDTLKMIQKKGGFIVKTKTKIEQSDLGYFALFLDSEGNKVGLYGEA